MGRKVHPVGFRLGIIRDWEARWYAPKGKYAQQLQQDFAIRRLVYTEAPKAGIARVEIDRSPSSVSAALRSFAATCPPRIAVPGVGT